MAEAETKKEQSTDGYSREKQRRKGGKTEFYKGILAGKEQGMTKKDNMSFLQVQEIFGTNLFFGMVFRRDKSDAVSRTEEDNNSKRVKGF